MAEAAVAPEVAARAEMGKKGEEGGEAAAAAAAAEAKRRLLQLRNELCAEANETGRLNRLSESVRHRHASEAQARVLRALGKLPREHDDVMARPDGFEEAFQEYLPYKLRLDPHFPFRTLQPALAARKLLGPDHKNPVTGARGLHPLSIFFCHDETRSTLGDPTPDRCLPCRRAGDAREVAEELGMHVDRWISMAEFEAQLHTHLLHHTDLVPPWMGDPLSFKQARRRRTSGLLVPSPRALQ